MLPEFLLESNSIMSKLDPFHFASGYKTRFIDALLFDVLIALTILILASPLFIIIPILIKFQDGGDVFYSGLRLGKNKKLFRMYKFRTLSPGAEQLLGEELVSTSKKKIVTPLGAFLRDTRIDELPQLINVLKGDMALIGPRPERQAVYEKSCSHIPWYDKRFKVKPGLFGYSQIFTPHSASRKSRALIDNFYLKRKHNLWSDFLLLTYAMMILGLKLVELIPSMSRAYFRRVVLGKKTKEKRSSARIKHNRTRINIWYQNPSEDRPQTMIRKGPPALSGHVININDEDIYIELSKKLEKQSINIELITKYSPFPWSKARHKAMHTNAHLKLLRKSENTNGGKFYYVIRMDSISQLNQLKLHKYFLSKSIS